MKPTRGLQAGRAPAGPALKELLHPPENVKKDFISPLWSEFRDRSGDNVMKFAQFCQWLAMHAGKPSTFLIAVVLIAMWAASGPWFHYNDTWQLIVNTSTTIITFLMVFLIQNTQNRDNDIIHVKLDELIRATKSAEQSVLDVEALNNRQIHQLRKAYQAMGSHCETPPQGAVEQRKDDER